MINRKALYRQLEKHAPRQALEIEDDADFDIPEPPMFISEVPAPSGLDALFDFVPVDLDTFIRDPAYLGLPPLSDIQYRTVEAATCIYPRELTELLGWPFYPEIDVVVALWGKGSGKDFIARISVCRVVYLLLALHSPQQVFGLAPLESIDVINMAYSSRQAYNIFFKPIKRMMVNSPFFANLGVFRKTQIDFPKSIVAHSGNSDNESFEGFNPIVVILDEIDAFRTDEDLRRAGSSNPEHSASGIYSSLSSSVQSRFPGRGKTFLLSYPRRPDGFIFQYYEQSINDPHMFGTKGATWEVNPMRTREDFDREFERNPEDASMRYGCEPTATKENFFGNRALLAEVCHFDLVTQRLYPDAPVNPFVDADFLPGYRIPANDALPRYVHCDIGISNDAVGLASVYLWGWVHTGHKGYSERLPVVAVDFLGTLDPHELGEIEISRVRNLIRKFRQLRVHGMTNLKIVTFDQYQSVDSRQILAKEGILTGQRSVDKDDMPYQLLKELIYSRRLLCPGSILLYKELAALRRTNMGKIDHPPGGSKDLGDALAGAVFNLYADLFADEEQKFIASSPMVSISDY